MTGAKGRKKRGPGPGPDPRRGGPVRIVAGTALLGLAIYLRARKPPAFANVDTHLYSANILFKDAADTWAIIKTVGGDLFGRFAVESLLPVFAVLLPAVLLLSAGLARLIKSDKGLFGFLAGRKGRALTLAALFAITLAGCLAAHFFVVGHYPPMGDEFCYMFGADQLGSGKLYADSPPFRDHFRSWSIINDGRWYSKVTVGWPLLLAAARPARLEFLLNPLLAAACVVLLFLIAERLFGAEAGLLAAGWGLLTTFFILTSGTYFPHTAAAFFSLLALHFALRTFDGVRRSFPVGAGLSMIALSLVRPTDGVVLFLGLAPFAALRWLRMDDKRRTVLKIAVIAALFLIGLGLLLAVNQVQNGRPLQFGYGTYDAGESWGFGVRGHTLLKGLWNTAYSLMRIGSWGVPFIGLFFMLSLLAKNATARLLAVPVFGHVALYAGFYTLASFEIGPRYYITMILLAMVPAAGGAVLVRDRLRGRSPRVSKAFIPGLLVSTALFVAAGIWPRLAVSVRAQMAPIAAESRAMAEPPVETPSLIFLRDHLQRLNIFWNRNYWRYESGRHVYVLYLTPAENRKVMEMFPTRKCYTVVLQPGSGRLEFVPYVDNSESPLNYLAAGLNYVEFEPAKAAAAFSRALAMRPNEPVLLSNLARAYDLTGTVENRAKAIDLYAKAAELGPASVRDMARFLQATNLRLLGRTREALTVYQDLARVGQDRYYRSRAQGWVGKLSRGSALE